MKTNTNRARDIQVLVLSVVGFNVIAMVFPEWSNPKTQAGGIVGVIALALLAGAVIRRWNKRLSKRQLAESKKAYAKSNSPQMLGVAVVISLLIYTVLSGGSFWPYILGFCSVIMGGGSILALLITISKRGMYQGAK